MSNSLKKYIITFAFIIYSIYGINSYKNNYIQEEIKEYDPFSSSLFKIKCSGYSNIECLINDINISILDGSDLKIPLGLLPKIGILKINLFGTKSNLYLNTDYLNINLNFINKFLEDIPVQIEELELKSKVNISEIIYEIYKVNFLDMQKNSDKEFLRGLNKSLGVDTSKLIDKKSFIKVSLIEFSDLLISEIENSIEIDEEIVNNIKDFILKDKKSLVLKFNGEVL